VEDEGIRGHSKLNSRTLQVVGRSNRFLTQEDRAISNLYSEMETSDSKKINWDDIKWDEDRKGYVSNGYIITFNYGDEYTSKGLYKIIPLVIE
jgi:hypothetical protein